MVLAKALRNQEGSLAMTVQVQHFSDILCVWAYVGQVRISELCRNHRELIEVKYHFIDIFGDVPGRIRSRWQERGGMGAYNQHVREVAARFEHVDVHPGVWLENEPTSSMSCHLFLRAVGEAEGEAKLEQAAWGLREGFFAQGLDVSKRSVQMEIAEKLRISPATIEEHLASGLAAARLSSDLRAAAEQGIKVSPTLSLNEGRQVLCGNVGYRVIEANIHELIEEKSAQHSWC